MFQVALSLLVLLPAAPRESLPAEKEAPLAWRFTKGKPFYQVMTTRTKQTMQLVAGDDNTQVQSLGQDQTQTFYYSFTPRDQDKEGNWIIAQKIFAVKMKIEIGGNTIQYDSTQKNQPAGPLHDFLEALLGVEWTFKLSPQLEVLEIEGHKEMLARLVKKNQQMEPLLKQILGANAMKQMVASSFPPLVGRAALVKGQSWTTKSDTNLGPLGSYSFGNRYTYAGKEGSLARIALETTSFKYQPPAKAAAGGLPFQIDKCDFRCEEGKGTLLFDLAKHRLAHSEMNMILKGPISITIGGKTTDLHMKQTQKTTVKTTDDNPLKP